jgi:hypothetical protein
MRAAGVETRHALFQELGVLGPSVFLNAGPFLRVRRSSAELTNADLMVRGFHPARSKMSGLRNRPGGMQPKVSVATTHLAFRSDLQ